VNDFDGCGVEHTGAYVICKHKFAVIMQRVKALIVVKFLVLGTL